MIDRASLFIVLVLFAVCLLVGCGGKTGPGEDGGYLHESRSTVTLPPNPLEDRENPLRIHIRDNWTGGDETSTGGLHYGHIKIFGVNWTSLNALPDGHDQAQFIADHFDMYVWGGTIVADYAYPDYQSFVWLHHTYSGIPYIVKASEIEDWLESPMNEGAYTWDSLVMHFKYDNTNIYGWYPGWNPDDDFDNDGCIEAGEGSGGEPSDPIRTAECIGDAEMMKPMPSSASDWNWARVLHDSYVDVMTDLTANDCDSFSYKGCFLDDAAFEVPYYYGLDSTFTYESSDWVASNLQYYLDKLFFVPNFTLELEQKTAQPLVVYVANMVSPLYTCQTGYTSCAKEWALEYLENVFDECWSMLITKENREDWLECPFLDYMEQGKGYIFNFLCDSGDREKCFSLATFYMINHQMAFYYYRTHGHITGEGEHVSEWQWNSYVEFDVGQPAVNTLLRPDFQGNSGTNLFFVWHEDSNYEILGREYLRDDGKRVLVLTKIMAQGQTEGSDPTTHSLTKTYKRVLPDLSLSDPIDQITLYNNDGAFLVEYEVPPPDGDKKRPIMDP